MQQALYNVSAYFTLQGIQAETEIREHLRLPTLMLAGLLFITASLPVLDSAKLNDLRPLEDTYQDMNLAEIASHLSVRLPTEHKKDSYKLAKLLLQLSDRHMLSPGLLLSVIETESSFRYSIVSKKGAVGLMQLLPDTAKEVAQIYHIHSYRTEADLYDPAVNLRLGAAYLS
ncbi:MAG: transglycosylase SLT domain-containing protein [Bdellovibrionota bacterium]